MHRSAAVLCIGLFLSTALSARAAPSGLEFRFADASSYGVVTLLGIFSEDFIVTSDDIDGRLRGELLDVTPAEALTWYVDELGLLDRGTGRWHVLVSRSWAPPVVPFNGPDCLSEKSISVHFTQTSILSMLQLAAYRSGAVITTPSSLDGRVTVVARDAPVGELVAALAATRGLSLACEGTGELVALWDPISTVPDPGPCTSIPVEGLDLPECSPSSRPSTPWGSYAKKARVITSPEMDDDQLDAVLEAALGGTLTREPGACARRTVSEPWLLLQPWSPTTEGCGAPETSERPLRRDGTQRGTEGHPDRPTPLQLWPVSDFRLTATVARGDEVFGLVEDPTGASHRVEVGSFIGPEWAKVTSLSPLEMELTVRYTTFEGEDVDVRSVVKLPLR